MNYCTPTTHVWVTLTRDLQICRECHETVVATDSASATARAVAQAARECRGCASHGAITAHFADCVEHAA